MIPMAHGRAFAESAEGILFTTFPGCSHYLHHDRPDLFAQVLRQFLDAPTVPQAQLRERPPATGKAHS